MHFTRVTIQRDETATVTDLVGAWEIPILELKHGVERLTIGESVDFPNRPWPEDARSEMQRLSTRYGTKGAGDDAMSFAERAYGEGSVGVRALERAIDEARKAAEGKPKKGKSKGAELMGATA